MGVDGGGNPLGAIQYDTDGMWPAFWECSWDECPGGKELRLRKAPIVDSYRTYDVPDYIEAKVYIGQVLTQKYVWVEVDGNE